MMSAPLLRFRFLQLSVSFALAACSSASPKSPAATQTGATGTGTSGTGAHVAAGTGGSGAAGSIGVAGMTSSSTAGAGAGSSGTGATSLDGGLVSDASAAGSGGGAGQSSVGGSGGSASEDEDAGSVCMPPMNKLDISSFPACPMNVCPAQDSVCIQLRLLQGLVPQSTIDQLADCDSISKCVPDSLATTAGKALLPHCTSLLGAEGRCLSTCVPQVASQASQLPKDICSGTDLCAPCYDPRTGKDTTACSQGCDTGPTQPPKTFAQCCSDRGFCVPPSLAGSLASNLLKDTCATGTMCAPKDLTDPTFKPKSCASLDNAEGRCLSTCLGGSVAAQKANLPTAGCGADEVCAPCYDPITGADTTACEINGDKPVQPKYQFPGCCDNGTGKDVGVCVPPSLAGSQASMLRQDTCGTGRLCAPIAKAENPSAKFPRCTGLGTGACVPSCILDPSEAGILSRASCAQGEVCAPCTIGTMSTGACD